MLMVSLKENSSPRYTCANFEALLNKAPHVA